MTFTGAPFQVCFAINGQNHGYLALFISYGYFNDLLFVLAPIFYLHEHPEGGYMGQLSLLIFLLIDVG